MRVPDHSFKSSFPSSLGYCGAGCAAASTDYRALNATRCPTSHKYRWYRCSRTILRHQNDCPLISKVWFREPTTPFLLLRYHGEASLWEKSNGRTARERAGESGQVENTAWGVDPPRPDIRVVCLMYFWWRADVGYLFLDAPDDFATVSNSSPKKKHGFWKSLDWKLMLALLLPVTLETLDYTSMSFNLGSQIVVRWPLMLLRIPFVVVATAQSRIAVSGLASFLSYVD